MKWMGWIVLGVGWIVWVNASVIPPAKIETCVACHGLTGVSVNPAWPSLAGQHAPYLLKQMQDMQQNKTRVVPVMQMVLSSLSPEELSGLAEFYAAQPIPKQKTPARYVARGEAVYRGGDFPKQITACIACHGPSGEGNAQAGFPVLSGQHALYTLQQLKAFHDKTRHNDLNEIMQDISGRMSDEDREAVAYYVQGLQSK